MTTPSQGAAPLMTWTRLWRPSAAMLIAGALAGAVWDALAKPALYEVTENGTVLTEKASTAIFAAVAVFVLIGVAVSFVWGWLVGGWAPALGWPVVAVAIVVAFVAAVLAWRVGVWLGPPDLSTVDGRKLGDTVPMPLSIDSLAPFLVWPIAAVAALLARVYMSSPD